MVIFSETIVEIEVVNPCQPTPCGPNSKCEIAGSSPSCSCLPSFSGAPPNCRPECVSNTECGDHLACINNKCRNPCSEICGSNAECRVVSHIPICVCLGGYTGDPFIQCTLPTSKLLLLYLYIPRNVCSLINSININCLDTKIVNTVTGNIIR